MTKKNSRNKNSQNNRKTKKNKNSRNKNSQNNRKTKKNKNQMTSGAPLGNKHIFKDEFIWKTPVYMVCLMANHRSSIEIFKSCLYNQNITNITNNEKVEPLRKKTFTFFHDLIKIYFGLEDLETKYPKVESQKLKKEMIEIQNEKWNLFNLFLSVVFQGKEAQILSFPGGDGRYKMEFDNMNIFKDGHFISELSKITGIPKSEIEKDYKIDNNQTSSVSGANVSFPGASPTDTLVSTQEEPESASSSNAIVSSSPSPFVSPVSSAIIDPSVGSVSIPVSSANDPSSSSPFVSPDTGANSSENVSSNPACADLDQRINEIDTKFNMKKEEVCNMNSNEFKEKGRGAILRTKEKMQLGDEVVTMPPATMYLPDMFTRKRGGLEKAAEKCYNNDKNKVNKLKMERAEIFKQIENSLEDKNEFCKKKTNPNVSPNTQTVPINKTELEDFSNLPQLTNEHIDLILKLTNKSYNNAIMPEEYDPKINEIESILALLCMRIIAYIISKIFPNTNVWSLKGDYNIQNNSLNNIVFALPSTSTSTSTSNKLVVNNPPPKTNTLIYNFERCKEFAAIVLHMFKLGHLNTNIPVNIKINKKELELNKKELENKLMLQNKLNGISNIPKPNNEVTTYITEMVKKEIIENENLENLDEEKKKQAALIINKFCLMCSRIGYDYFERLREEATTTPEDVKNTEETTEETEIISENHILNLMDQYDEKENNENKQNNNGEKKKEEFMKKMDYWQTTLNKLRERRVERDKEIERRKKERRAAATKAAAAAQGSHKSKVKERVQEINNIKPLIQAVKNIDTSLRTKENSSTQQTELIAQLEKAKKQLEEAKKKTTRPVIKNDNFSNSEELNRLKKEKQTLEDEKLILNGEQLLCRINLKNIENKKKRIQNNEQQEKLNQKRDSLMEKKNELNNNIEQLDVKIKEKNISIDRIVKARKIISPQGYLAMTGIGDLGRSGGKKMKKRRKRRNIRLLKQG